MVSQAIDLGLGLLKSDDNQQHVSVTTASIVGPAVDHVPAVEDADQGAIESDVATASTPSSTVGASTVANPSPVTPADIYGTESNVVVAQQGSAEQVIANGHLESDTSDEENESGRFSDDENDPFVTSGDESDRERTAGVAPRDDRDMSAITSENAQAVLPPNACVFVANLLATRTDEVLTEAVQAAFARFGVCYTKIRRDSRGMPFAFVQYHERHASERAILHGRGMPIEGRPCRTERARVPRALYLSRVTGGPISRREAREILAGHGSLESMWHPSPTDREMFHLPEGIWLEFGYFNDARDAQASFRNSQDFRLEQPALPEDLRAKLISMQNPPVTIGPFPNQRPAGPQGWEWTRRPDTNYTSLFIGNLPYDATAHDVAAVFSRFGNLESVDIIMRSRAVHAFVKFTTMVEANAALRQPSVLSGRTLRVERRLSSQAPQANGNNGATANAPAQNPAPAPNNGPAGNHGMHLVFPPPPTGPQTAALVPIGPLPGPDPMETMARGYTYWWPGPLCPICGLAPGFCGHSGV